MEFKEAFNLMKNGAKIKMPEWAGYWAWEENTIMLHCKDGVILDIRETEDPLYTFSFIVRDDWEVTSDSYDIPTTRYLHFSEALRLLKLHKYVRRVSWGQSYVECQIADIFSQATEPYLSKTTINMSTLEQTKIPWVPSQEDLFANDWVEYVSDEGFVHIPEYEKTYNVELISGLLKDLGVTPAISGYHLLREGIFYVQANPWAINHIIRDIYQPLAEKYGITSSKVQRAMRTAIEVSWEKADLTLCQEIFGFTVSMNKGKPTPSEYICTLADYINLRRKSGNI